MFCMPFYTLCKLYCITIIKRVIIELIRKKSAVGNFRQGNFACGKVRGEMLWFRCRENRSSLDACKMYKRD